MKKWLLILMLALGVAGRIHAAEIAEARTPEIVALARGLENDPVRIFKYVHDNIRHTLYYGSKKGAHLTLLEKSGNDFDQCALLVALLRAGNQNSNNVVYRHGLMTLPLQSPDMRDINHWLGVNLSNVNFQNTSNYLSELLRLREYSANNSFATVSTNNNYFRIDRVWVELDWQGTKYHLDPAFKISESITGIDLKAAMGITATDLLAAAGGSSTNTVEYSQALNESDLALKLRTYTEAMLANLTTTNANKSVIDISGGRRIVPHAGPLSTIAPVTQVTPQTWLELPTDQMTTLKISIGSTPVQTWNLPELQGRRISLFFDTGGEATLWLDDTTVITKQTSGGSEQEVTITVDPPYAPSLVNAAPYIRTDSSYAIFYALEPNVDLIRSREAVLERYRSGGKPDTSREVITETLNVMGLKWTMQTMLLESLVGNRLGTTWTYLSRVGRMSQEKNRGYYVDAYMMLSTIRPTIENPAPGSNVGEKQRGVTAHFGSALEHALIEQMQSSNLVASSTVKMLQIANANPNLKVFLADSNNWASGRNISGLLYGYDASDLNKFGTKVANGSRILLPENGSQTVTTGGDWNGWGAAEVFGTSSEVSYGMLISGGYYGAFTANKLSTVNPGYVNQVKNVAPTVVHHQTAADPVSMVDGSFLEEQTDLALGEAEPRGLRFTRHYNSRRNRQNVAELGHGWTHNYYFKITETSAPEAGLGETTPEQMAPMLAALTAAAEVYNSTPDAKNWMVTALIAKWGVDQLIRNAVSVTLGNDTIQFIKQPNGTFTPPANSTFSLGKTNNVYHLQERNGRTFIFNASNRLAQIKDPYNQAMTFTYDGGGRLWTVADWKNRTLTFTYANVPMTTPTQQRLTQVADSTGRAVNYIYTNAFTMAPITDQPDLGAVVDVENQTSRYLYGMNTHLITEVRDGKNEVVTRNFYDALERVEEQHSEGDANKQWKLLYTGRENTEVNPQQGKRRFWFDEKMRAVGMVDALGNTNLTFYDGQDHVVQTVTPKMEVTKYVYDSRHNLQRTKDALGKFNYFYYDVQDRLWRKVDARGYTNEIGYNAQHSVTSTVNAMGDWVTFDYNADGTLNWKREPKAGGYHETTYEYDPTLRHLTKANYPTSPLTFESWVRNARGEVTDYTDGRGYVTASTYNKRSQPLTRATTSNLVTSASYDAVGNLEVSTDARGLKSTNFWSATRKLKGTGFEKSPGWAPATGDWAVAVTNLYDARDWLVESRDPLARATVITPDAAGRAQQIRDPLLRTTHFGYDANGRQTTSTNHASEKTGQGWSERGEPVRVTDPLVKSVLRKFDDAGNGIILSNRNGMKWQFDFDAANRLTNTISPMNRSWGQAWNDRGLLRTTREPSNESVSFTYDGKGRVATRTEYNSAGGPLRTLVYSYDGNDNLTAITRQGSGEALSWTYDAYDRPLSYTDSVTGSLGYRYDGNGNLTKLIYPGNREVNYAYDRLNRLTNIVDWGNRQTRLEYDAGGQLRRVVQGNGTARELGYDAGGQLTNLVERRSAGVNGAALAVRQMGWNGAGRMEWEFAGPLGSVGPQPGRVMVVTNDDRLLSVNSAPVASDADGNMTGVALAGGVWGQGVYNELNQLKRVNKFGTVLHAAYQTTGAVVNFGSAGESFGPVNLRLANGQALAAAEPARLAQGVRNNVTGWQGFKFQVGEEAVAVSQLGRWVVAGNSQSHVVKLVTAAGADVAGGSATVGTAGQTARAFAYANLTNNGTVTLLAHTEYYLLSQETTGGDWWHDSPGTVVHAGWGYGYDLAGNRTAVTNGAAWTRNLVNPNAALPQTVARYHPDANGAFSTATFYVYGPGLLYEVGINSGGQDTVVRYYHYDYRGSTIALTDGTGNVTDRIEYSSYGLVLNRTGTTPTPFLFNGQYGVMSDGGGLYYMRARYYNAWVCRFMNADPSGFGGGLNWYAFADGNPISLIDPFGLGAQNVGLGSWLGQAAGGFFVDGAWGTARGLYQAGRHPIDTASGLYNAAVNYDQTFHAIVGGLQGFGSRVANGDPRAIGQGVFEAASFFVPLRVGKLAGEVKAFQVGRFHELQSASRVGDDLFLHHAGQKHAMKQVVQGYDPATAPTIAVPKGQHEFIPNLRGSYSGTARGLMARDIRNLRNYTDAPNSSLQELIQLNKQLYPQSFAK